MAHISPNLADAMRWLSVGGNRIDLALLDLYLPDGGGLELMRRLDCDVFVVSAAAESVTVRTALSRGALAYLIKPFPDEMLTDRLTAYARYRAVLDRTGRGGAGRARPGAAHPACPVREPAQGAFSAHRAGGRARRWWRPTDPVSAAEVAEQVGISRATAQRYLSLLAESGSISMQLRYGATGRPEHRFSAPE